MRLKNDKCLRDNLFTPESYQHPAKGHLGLWQAIIEKYTLPGETILDPMAGVGATLTAALMGRNVICVELEPHFIAPMKASWEKMRQHPMLGHTLGEVLILRGDARHMPIASADHIVTSPPFGTVEAFEDKAFMEREGKAHYSGGITERDGRTHFSGYTRPQAIITSPPYEASEVAQSSDGEANRRFRAGEYTGDARKGMGLSKGYTRPVDAVVTSPSYEGTRQDGGGQMAEANEGGFHAYTQEPPNYWHTQRNQTNIGNLRGDAYWEAMLQVYEECLRILKPDGLLCLVLKGFTRDGEYVDLPAQTATLCESLGFTLFDTWWRELWSLSFWRILQGTSKVESVVAHRQGLEGGDLEEIKRMKRVNNGKLDERLRYETVLAFRKPLAPLPMPLGM